MHLSMTACPTVQYVWRKFSRLAKSRYRSQKNLKITQKLQRTRQQRPYAYEEKTMNTI